MKYSKKLSPDDSIINEGFLGIDINDIKKKAFKFSQSSQFRNSLSELDDTLIKEIELEIRGIKNADDTISKIFQKFSNSNESMSLIGITILSLFGLHAILKLLIAVKRGWSFSVLLDS